MQINCIVWGYVSLKYPSLELELEVTEHFVARDYVQDNELSYDTIIWLGTWDKAG